MERTPNYWQRLSRRRFLAASGVAAVGTAAILAGCGDDDSGGSTSTSGGGKSGSHVPSPPQISLAPDLKTIYSGTPVKGGTLNFVSGTPDQYDPARDAGYPGLQQMGPCLSSLVRAHYPILGELTMESDLAEKWEQP